VKCWNVVEPWKRGAEGATGGAPGAPAPPGVKDARALKGV